jgi:hypothetical protein
MAQGDHGLSKLRKCTDVRSSPNATTTTFLPLCSSSNSTTPPSALRSSFTLYQCLGADLSVGLPPRSVSRMVPSTVEHVDLQLEAYHPELEHPGYGAEGSERLEWDDRGWRGAREGHRIGELRKNLDPVVLLLHSADVSLPDNLANTRLYRRVNSPYSTSWTRSPRTSVNPTRLTFFPALSLRHSSTPTELLMESPGPRWQRCCVLGSTAGSAESSCSDRM